MRSTRLWVRLGLGLGLLGLSAAACQVIGEGAVRAQSRTAKPDLVAVGYEIFNREWMPGDPRSHGGDGLGPVYNDTSCVACHNSGGSGGAGPVSKNIDILSASLGGAVNVFDPTALDVVDVPALARAPASPGKPAAAQAASAARPPSRASNESAAMGSQALAEELGHLPATLASIKALTKQLRVRAKGRFRSPAPAALIEQLAGLHAGFRTSRSVVLHKFGTDPNYDSWRSGALLSESRQQSGVLISGGVGPTRDVRTEQLVRALQEEIAVERSQTAPNASVLDRSADRIRQVRAEMLANNPTLQQPAIAFGTSLVSRSQRNPSPLFGLGLIDAIPAEAIEAIANRQANESPGTQGRPSRLKEGRIGRLGWKGQTADVRDFVLTACAVELGLEVPGHHQALIPQAPKYQPPGLDLTSDECDALIAYVRSLPRPIERKATSAAEAEHLAAGKAAFSRIGCASCHTAKVGNVEGLYSDLLLHDMGQEMAQQGSYSDSSGDFSDEPQGREMPPGVARNGPAAPASNPTNMGATRREWRTPPLWGFRDSGPYLHDGRAQTLEQAVAMHDGQGAKAAQRFFQLSPRERLQVEAFLKSLVAPVPVQLARAGD